MPRRKLERFEAITLMDHVFTPKDEPNRNWRETFESRNKSGPIIVELACGSGYYTTDLAQKDSSRRYIGIDIKGARIYFGAKRAIDQGLDHVMFFRMPIEHLEQVFTKGEIDEIWITFPDPFLADRRKKRRLTSERFMTMYKALLKPGGLVRLKTDSDELYAFTKEEWNRLGVSVVDDIWDVYTDDHDIPELTEIQTTYEKSHLSEGRTIHYISGGFL